MYTRSLRRAYYQTDVRMYPRRFVSAARLGFRYGWRTRVVHDVSVISSQLYHQSYSVYGPIPDSDSRPPEKVEGVMPIIWTIL